MGGQAMRLPFTSSARQSHREPRRQRTRQRRRYFERLEDRCLLTTVVPLFDAALAEAEASDRQILTPSPATLGAVRGENFHFDIVYTTDPLHEQLSGIGFRIHYDSTQVTLDEAATAATLFDAPIANMQVQNDTANSDGDTDTDKLLLVALASGVTPDFPAREAAGNTADPLFYRRRKLHRHNDPVQQIVHGLGLYAGCRAHPDCADAKPGPHRHRAEQPVRERKRSRSGHR